MPLYNEQTTEITKTVTTFDRAYQVSVSYPNNGTPSIRFDEEKIKREGGVDTTMGRIGFLKKDLNPDNKDTVFNLMDTETGEVTGTATYDDLRVMLFSLYFHLATERDTQE